MIEFGQIPVSKLDILNDVLSRVTEQHEQFAPVINTVYEYGDDLADLYTTGSDAIQNHNYEIVSDYYKIALDEDQYQRYSDLAVGIANLLADKTITYMDMVEEKAYVLSGIYSTYSSGDRNLFSYIDGERLVWFVTSGSAGQRVLYLSRTSYTKVSNIVLGAFNQISNASIDSEYIMQILQVFNNFEAPDIHVFENLYSILPTKIKSSNAGILLSSIITDVRSFDGSTIVDSVVDGVKTLYTKISDACSIGIKFDDTDYDPSTSFVACLDGFFEAIQPVLTVIGYAVGGIVGVISAGVGLVTKVVGDILDLSEQTHGSMHFKKADAYVYAKPFIQWKCTSTANIEMFNFMSDVYSNYHLKEGHVYKLMIMNSVLYFWCQKTDHSKSCIYVEGKIQVRWSPIAKLYCAHLQGVTLDKSNTFDFVNHILNLSGVKVNASSTTSFNGETFTELVGSRFDTINQVYTNSDRRASFLSVNLSYMSPDLWAPDHLDKWFNQFILTDEELEMISELDTEESKTNLLLAAIAMDSISLFTTFFNGINTGRGQLMPDRSVDKIYVKDFQIVQSNNTWPYVYNSSGGNYYTSATWLYSMLKYVDRNWASLNNGDNIDQLITVFWSGQIWEDVNYRINDLWANYTLEGFNSYLTYIRMYDTMQSTWNTSFNKIRAPYELHLVNADHPIFGCNLIKSVSNKANGLLYPAKWASSLLLKFWIAVGAVFLTSVIAFTGFKMFQLKMSKKAWALQNQADILAFGETDEDITTTDGQKRWYKQWRKKSKKANFYSFLAGIKEDDLPDDSENDLDLSGLTKIQELITND